MEESHVVSQSDIDAHEKAPDQCQLRRSARLSKSLRPGTGQPVREQKGTKRKRGFDQTPIPAPCSARLSRQSIHTALEARVTGENHKRTTEVEQAIPQERPHTGAQRLPTAAEAIAYWCGNQVWPREYLVVPTMSERVLRRQKSASTLGRKRSIAELRSQPSSASDFQSREGRSAAYRDPKYEIRLRNLGFKILTKEAPHSHQLSGTSGLLEHLNNHPQDVPTGTLFDEIVYHKTLNMVHEQNEARVVRDIGLLMVPSPAHLHAFGALELGCFAESVNQAWNNCIPLTRPRPQPDFTVGFNREAFTEEQTGKLDPYIGDLDVESCFMATFEILFPFFTCEVKCGNAALNIADRQNLHSAYLCGQGIFELFKLVGREQELHQQYLSFSIAHDDSDVRIHAYMALIDRQGFSYHRKLAGAYSIRAFDGRDRWTSYKFTRNVYKLYGLPLLEKIRSVIDQLPAGHSAEESRPDVNNQPTGLSQELYSSSLIDVIDAGDTSQPMPTPESSNTQQGRKKQKGKRN